MAMAEASSREEGRADAQEMRSQPRRSMGRNGEGSADPCSGSEFHIYRRGRGASPVPNPDWSAFVKTAVPPTPSPPDPIATEYRCAIRRLVAETAAARLGAVFEGYAATKIEAALRLHECPTESPGAHVVERSGRGGRWPEINLEIATADTSDGMVGVSAKTVAFVVSPTGSDITGDGSAASPFGTPCRARDAVRAARRAAGLSPAEAPATVTLEPGVYHLGAPNGGGPLTLGPLDSYTTWVSGSSGDSRAWLSGTVDLAGLVWSPYRHTGDPVLVAELPPGFPSDISALFADAGGGKRLIRARAPNADPESTSGLCFNGNGLLDGVEGCSGYFRAGSAAGGKFVGATLKRVRFNTTRGGVVPGDAIYREYDVIFQAPPPEYV